MPNNLPLPDPNLEALFDLKKGECVEAGKPMPALCDEPALFLVNRVCPDRTFVSFNVYYHTIWLGRWQLRRMTDGTFDWSHVKGVITP